MDNESVVNLRYADVSLTTVRREWCFSHSERFVTFHWSRHEYGGSGEELQLTNFLYSVRDNAALMSRAKQNLYIVGH